MGSELMGSQRLQVTSKYKESQYHEDRRNMENTLVGITMWLCQQIPTPTPIPTELYSSMRLGWGMYKGGVEE